MLCRPADACGVHHREAGAAGPDGEAARAGALEMLGLACQVGRSKTGARFERTAKGEELRLSLVRTALEPVMARSFRM